MCRIRIDSAFEIIRSEPDLQALHMRSRSLRLIEVGVSIIKLSCVGHVKLVSLLYLQLSRLKENFSRSIHSNQLGV